jgi:hypothetical protein
VGRLELCPHHVALSNKVTAIGTDVENLKDYRDKQNGALLRLTEQTEEIRRWLTGLLGGMVVSLLLLVVNLVVTWGMRR